MKTKSKYTLDFSERGNTKDCPAFRIIDNVHNGFAHQVGPTLYFENMKDKEKLEKLINTNIVGVLNDAHTMTNCTMREESLKWKGLLHELLGQIDFKYQMILLNYKGEN